jgi:hypothetical protein
VGISRRAAGSRPSGPSVSKALRNAAASPGDIDIASVYDDYPVMVLIQLADLGFRACIRIENDARLAVLVERPPLEAGELPLLREVTPAIVRS